MSVSKNMPTMFEYHRKIVENTSAKMIVGNFSRGAGKSYVMACKVLYDRPSLVFFVANNDSQFKSLQDKFKEVFSMDRDVNSDILYFGESKAKIEITFKSGEKTIIYNYRQFKTDDYIQRKIPNLLLYSDCLPVDNILGEQIISMVSIPVRDLKRFFGLTGVLVVNAGLKELYENKFMDKECIDELREGRDRFFGEDIDLFNEYEMIFGKEIETKLNKIEWIDKQIEDLMNEFGGIVKNEKTTMTREKVLGLIENLIKIKANYNCKQ